MSFSGDIQAFAVKVEQRAKDTLVEATMIVHESITVGSPITGAPGQPVDTSFLLNSWQTTFPDDVTGRVATNVVYARSIEEGTRVASHGVPRPPEMKSTLLPGERSPIGGPHSFKLTVASWDRIQVEAARRAKGEAPAGA